VSDEKSLNHLISKTYIFLYFFDAIPFLVNKTTANSGRSTTLHTLWGCAVELASALTAATILADQWRCQRSIGLKEPGHFEVRKSSSKVDPDAHFPQKVDYVFSYLPQNTSRQRRYTVKIKQIEK